jgi:hypothetical protein
MTFTIYIDKDLGTIIRVDQSLVNILFDNGCTLKSINDDHSWI